MLVLENYAPHLIHSDDQKRKKACYDKNQSSAKYTKNKTRGNQDKQGQMRGWTIEGVVRFNKCV
jgi:hypothetical protein